MTIDPSKLDAFLGKAVGDLGAAISAVLVSLGDELGFYRALAQAALTPAQLASRTGTHERYVREWLAAQAAAGYVEYDAGADRFHLNPEQATVFADEDSPAFMAGAFEVLSSLWIDEPKVAEAFQVRAWPGTTIAPAYSAAPSASSVPATMQIWFRHGCQRSTAWSRS